MGHLLLQCLTQNWKRRDFSVFVTLLIRDDSEGDRLSNCPTPSQELRQVLLDQRHVPHTTSSIPSLFSHWPTGLKQFLQSTVQTHEDGWHKQFFGLRFWFYFEINALFNRGLLCLSHTDILPYKTFLLLRINKVLIELYGVRPTQFIIFYT